MLGAAIFDFDGVISDTEILHLRAFNKVLIQYGIELTTQQYYKDYLGLTDRDCLMQLVHKDSLRLSNDAIEELMRQKQAAFKKLLRKSAPIMDGVPQFLQLLKENNVPTAICSGTLYPEIKLILEKNQLTALFDVTVSAEDVEKGKPDPQGFILALTRLNKKRQDPILARCCVAIEDSNWGLRAAKAAGMHTIAITNTYDASELILAEITVGNLNQIAIEDLHKLCARPITKTGNY